MRDLHVSAIEKSVQVLLHGRFRPSAAYRVCVRDRFQFSFQHPRDVFGDGGPPQRPFHCAEPICLGKHAIQRYPMQYILYRRLRVQIRPDREITILCQVSVQMIAAGIPVDQLSYSVARNDARDLLFHAFGMQYDGQAD